MTKEIFLLREQIMKKIRLFFEEKGFHEVMCPVLNHALPLEPNIYAFQVGNYFLTTSPEACLKKAIATGLGNCYSHGKSFRNVEKRSLKHSPEFLMLEWYRENANYKKILNEVKELIRFLSVGDDFYIVPRAWPVLSMIDLFKKHAKINLQDLIDDKKMVEAAAKKGYQTQNATWEQLFNQIFLNEIEPNIGNDPCFIVDFPSKISPLCAPKKDNPDFAERFELYIGKMELANGNTENTDADAVRKYFLAEKEWREENKISAPPIDEEFLEALNVMKNKIYAGVGLGIDRLVMLFAGCDNINEVI